MTNKINAAKNTHVDDKSNVMVSRLLLIIALLSSCIIRFRLLGLPLERDEGEFGYIAQLILKGQNPFVAYNYKLPGVSSIYAIFIALFGETVQSIHIAAMVFNIAAIIVLFFLARKFASPIAVGIACLLYAFMSIDSGVLGSAAHATQFLNFFALSGCLYLLYATQTDKLIHYALSGLMFGLAFVVKQPAIVFVCFGIVYVSACWFIMRRTTPTKFIVRLIWYLAGVLFPYMLIVFWAVGYDSLGLFWKWTYLYPKNYSSILTLKIGLINLNAVAGTVTGNYKIVWILALTGLVWTLRIQRDKVQKLFLILFATFSAMSVLPGYYFRPHYFVVLLPAIALCFALLFDLVSEKFQKRIPNQSTFVTSAIFVAVVGLSVAQHWNYYFKATPDLIENKIYRGNPFKEAIKVSEFIKSITSENDKIAILGSEAEILYYTRRTSATGYLFMYELVKPHVKNIEMQQEVISEIEAAKPKIVVLINSNLSWLVFAETPKTIFTWFDSFSAEYYSLVGVVDKLPDGTVYKFGADAAGYTPLGNNFILVFKRKEQ